MSLRVTPEEFVACSGWRYAKTMPECPHEYTVRDLSPGGEKTTAMGDSEFEWFVRLIRDKGELAEWGGKVRPYLRVGGYRYWTMGAPVEETTIINREPVTPEAWTEMNGRIAGVAEADLSCGGRLPAGHPDADLIDDLDL